MWTAEAKTKQSDGKHTVWIVLFLAAVSLVLIGVILETGRMSGGRKETHPVLLTQGWYYVRDGVKQPVGLPEEIEPEGETFVLCNDSLTADMAGKTLTTRGAQYGMQIALDGAVLFEYQDTYFRRNEQMKSKQYCDAVIPADYPGGGTLSLTFHKAEKKEISLFEVRIGNGRDVMIYHLKEAAVTFGIAVIFLILGVISMGTAGYLHWKKIDGRRFVDAALFLFGCSIWFITDTAMVQELSGYAPVICEISFYAFMLMTVPIIYFVKHITGMEKYRQLDGLAALFYLNAIVQGILHMGAGVEFIDMLFVTHLLLLVGISVITVLLVWEYRQNPNRDIQFVLLAFALLAGSGLLALLLYWLFAISYYGNIFEFGILFFVAVILANIEIEMAENIHYKTEMQVYQRMAREDWMTGMQNRQPFEEQMTALQNKVPECRNAVLIFMDLNQLKKTNDEYGHAAGDELIIGAAECIQNTFREVGTSYRIGGDEFAAILFDPDGTQEEWFARLDREISEYNKGSRYQLSIARGWSDLRKEDGSWKTVSDWKYEADYRMYEDKGGMRRI